MLNEVPQNLKDQVLVELKQTHHVIPKVDILINSTALKKILSIVCKRENVNEIDVKSGDRYTDLKLTRHKFFWICRKLGGKLLTLEAIGLEVNRHHATVLHGVKMIDKKILESKPFQKEMFYLEQLVKESLLKPKNTL